MQELQSNLNDLLKVGDILTFKHEIISEAGFIIAKRGQSVEIEDILKTPGYWGKRTGIYHNEKIYGFKLKGYTGEWRLSAFVETSKT